ncbi:MAG: putative sugar nucleotidyl transferase [Melioribacteraceae bacterium]|nr:putative sugar nucleotidyl transferase [Melioribacteraceae bacterium]
MKKTICIFEDNGFENLYPLTYLRPIYELKCGIYSLLDKIKIYLGDNKYYHHSRNVLSSVLDEKYESIITSNFPDEDIIFINGKVLFNDKFKFDVLNLKPNEALVNNDDLLAAFISKDNIQKLIFDENGLLDFNKINLTKIEYDTITIKFPWDLVNNNSNEIINDFKLFNKSNNLNKKLDYVSIKNKKDIFISSSADISPFVYFDASEGPIIIDSNVKILSHTYLKGPIYIGKNSLVKANTSIYHGTSIGQFCKVGGEIEESIIHSYSNKQHDGFLGHSYLAEWINLGAGTNNSDLKNNYSKISVLLNGKNVFTNSQFVGVVIGDHTKTAINTKINTGSIFGIGCNIYGDGFPPKYLPSFSWGGSDEIINYEFDKFIETANIVMKRRNVELKDTYTKLLKLIYDKSLAEKQKVK